ncbi:hypothetical protein HPB47_005006 [Ixodes persulcatus]|uniref:Uncharacterized protein n=1 Tax=Ixodes persulcatus TaxID=34615 RepID=A0AC60PFI5_IXOPE|nr:hypothetical protein HPB47_005006 [Ixodes persulcatus]
MHPSLEQHLQQNEDESECHTKFSRRKPPRKAPSSGPQLVASPEKLLVFEEVEVVGGFETLMCAIDVTNRSSKTVNFKFSRDPEFKFEPCDGCISPRCSATVVASFYNVDGNCSPRKSSVELRAIRIRTDHVEDIQKLWLCTPAKLVTRKRWKFQFNRIDMSSSFHSPTPGAETGGDLGNGLDGTDKVPASSSVNLEEHDASHDDKTNPAGVRGQRMSMLYRDHYLLGRTLFWLGFVPSILAAWRLAVRAPQTISEDCWKIWDGVYCL